ncbi:putative peroxisomal 2,4-dienoyl-CoA reductase [Cocos nucifera]|uniref:2,4-dienoyl-CoA reductase [(3E)-enoyl-CoA-producing] n=1 Tax=Cocos nucifera TaxID=13894 RepID=A0A8K0NAB6_COCNU|nr:putative peroxisomal 2,4-dienoyl-CoA reductase [Cocos nucifera]
MESPFKPELLKGKVALITGGGSGIGLEISTQFGRHGAAVAIMGRRRHILDAAVAALQSEGIQVDPFTQILSRIRVNGIHPIRGRLVWGDLPKIKDDVDEGDKIITFSCTIVILCDNDFKSSPNPMIGYPSLKSGIQDHPQMAIGLEGDVRKREDSTRVIETTIRHFGKLDILVNGAAGNFLASPEDLSPNGFRTVLDIDSVGTYTMCHEALKYLKKGGPGKGPSTGGLILNISATLHYTASWYQIHLCAAKAAVDSITRSLALEWGTDYNIRVNGIAPGAIEGTPGLRKLYPEEMTSKTQEYMPLFKFGEKWDIAMAALYLASDAGKCVNGTTMVVDGGLWLSRPRHISKEEVKELSRVIEKKSRASRVGVPTSKL